MKKYISKDWKKILFWFAGVTIAIVLLFIYSENRATSYDSTISQVSADKDILEVGEPKYVEYEDINTNDTYIKKKGDYKYSQIKVKNNSNNTLYQIRIELKEQEMNNSQESDVPEFVVPSYNIDVLEPGESAILSNRHENIKNDEKLELVNYYYCDGEGTSYTVSKSLVENKVKFKINSQQDEEFYKYYDTTPEVDILSSRYLSEKEQNNKIYYEMEIKNTSSIEIDKIYLTFNEYLDENIVGNYFVSYTDKLSPGETGILKFNSSNKINLELVHYGYSTYNEPDKKLAITNYNVYIKQGKYKFYNYEDPEVSSRRALFSSIINIVVILLIWILDVVSRKVKEKGVLEKDETYIKCSKTIRIVRIMIFIAYVIFLLFDIFI